MFKDSGSIFVSKLLISLIEKPFLLVKYFALYQYVFASKRQLNSCTPL